MDGLREWLPPEVSNQWVVWSLALGFGFIILVGLIRSLFTISHYGLWNWLKASFTINDDTWWLIAVLILLGMSCGFVFLI